MYKKIGERGEQGTKCQRIASERQIFCSPVGKFGEQAGNDMGNSVGNSVGNIYENGVITPKKNVPHVVSLGNTIDFGEQENGEQDYQ
jgi:hypothetical protein